MQPTTLHAQKRAQQQGYTPERQLAFALVESERNRQIEKWGNADNHDMEWLTILAEEFGEVARALLERDEHGLKIELAQVAAVAAAWLEHRVE